MTDNEWGDLYDCLYAFTDKLLRSKTWFRGPMHNSSIKGKEVHDYVMDGIERYLTETEKYKAVKGSLSDYIKYNIIRSFVHNDCISAENRTSFDVFGFSYEEDEDISYEEAMLPYTEAVFDQQMDYDLVMLYIEQETKGDDVVENIFFGVSLGLKRGDIMQEFSMSAAEYGNGMRRLSTILRRAVDKFDLKPSLS